MDYPYIGCFKPVTIPDKKRKGHKLLVSCGTCKSCLNARLERYKRLCELEELSEYKYTYFATLTYDNDHVPTYELIATDDNRYKLKDLNPRSSNYGLLSDESYTLSDDELKLLSDKCNVGAKRFTYLYYRDVQLFHKVLRKRIYTKYGEKIRMFAVGEYGPTSLRAHWHVVYFSRVPLPAVFSNRYFGKIWPYGFAHADRSFGGSIAYAAGYLNSGFVLPRLYKTIGVSPLTRHSVKLGYSYIKMANFEAFGHLLSCETARGKSFTANYITNGFSKRLPLDKTHKNTIYPKPPRFDLFRANKSLLSYLRAYEYYRQVFADCDVSSVKALASCVFDSLYRCKYNLTDYDREFRDLLQTDDVRYPFFPDAMECAELRLYRFLLWSKLYCSRTAEDADYLKKLFAFYDALDYNALLHQLQTQEEHFNAEPYTDDALDLYYSTTYSFKKLRQSLLYNQFVNKHEETHRKKLARKKFNDLAGMFNQ